MKITDAPIAVTGVAKVQSAFRALLFNVTFNTATTATALTQARDTKLKIEVRSQSGLVTVVPELSLLDVLETSSIMSRGALELKTDATKSYLEGGIILGVDGDIVPGLNEEYVVTISGLAAGATCDIYALESKRTATQRYEYNPVYINANTPTNVPVGNAKYVSMPMTSLKQVEFEQPGGMRLALLPPEIKDHLRSLNPSCLLTNGAVTAIGVNLFNFPCDASVNALISTSAAANVIVTRVKPV